MSCRRPWTSKASTRSCAASRRERFAASLSTPPVPSQFAHELINANPFAFLDDAGLEEQAAPGPSASAGALPDSVADGAGRLRPGRPSTRSAAKSGPTFATSTNSTTCCTPSSPSLSHSPEDLEPRTSNLVPTRATGRFFTNVSSQPAAPTPWTSTAFPAGLPPSVSHISPRSIVEQSFTS